MAQREREILEHAVHTIAEQAVKADELVDEAKAAGGGDHPVTVHAKMLRLELLKVKADLERELEDFSLLFQMRPRRSLGLGARDHARSLGAPGTRAARRACRLGTGRPCAPACGMFLERVQLSRRSPTISAPKPITDMTRPNRRTLLLTLPSSQGSVVESIPSSL